MPLKLNFKKLSLVILCVFAFFPSFSQGSFKLYAPAAKSKTTNNMPVFSWQKVPCTNYELWIDGILMEKTKSSVNSCVPFPMSYGKHTWYVVAVDGSKRTESNRQEITIDDAPLSVVPQGALLLRQNWKVISSLKAGIEGAKISIANVNTKAWATTSIPATVLTALVRDGLYPNPYVGMNNMLIPDASDDYNNDYNLLKYSHIPNTNPWKDPYWYRNEFMVPANLKGKMIWLNFGEINYKAEVWLNGKKIADTSLMIGMERSFRFDISKFVRIGSLNTVAVAIYPPNHPGKPSPEPLTPFADPGCNMADGMIAHDYTKWDVLGWDWQPAVRDRDMGITEDVFISTTEAIEISDLYVSSDLYLPDTTSADITISASLVNHSNAAQKGNLKGTISIEKELITFALPFSLRPNETKEIVLDKNTVAKLLLKNTKLWWPYGYGKPNLYSLSLTAETAGGQKAKVHSNFGIRKLETYIGAKERVYKINGRQIYCKGGNWVIDMMLNWNAERYEQEILLTRNANLNILRVWGPTGVAPQALYDAADKYGILLWQDFLNDFWGTFKNSPGFQPEISLFEKATVGIVKKLRNHPSLIIWCGGNEGPNPREELIVNSILPKYDGRGNRHYLKQSDGDGLHGGGPYNTLEPEDYFTHPKLMGFSSEIGPSGIPVIQSLQKFMPVMGKTWQPGRFPIDGTWAYHDANDWPGNDTRKFTSYDNMLRNYYGAPDSSGFKGVEDYCAKTQLVNYDVYRASIESINRQLWSNASGILLWKSNSSWPSATWQLYDWYLQAHAGYYGAKKAGEAIHIQMNRDNNQVSLLNTTDKSLSKINITATLLNINMKATWSGSAVASIGPDSVMNIDITVPVTEEMQFLKLQALDAQGHILSENLYWLSATNNYKALNTIPAPVIDAKVKTVKSQFGNEYELTIKNTGKSIALMLNFRLVGLDSRQEILPSFWSDNFFSLLPGEEKIVTVKTGNSGNLETPAIDYNSFNAKAYKFINF